MRLNADEFPAEGDFDIVDDGAGREVEDIGEIDAGLEIDVMDHAGGGVVEMAVLAEIRTVARGLAVEIHLADDAVLDEGFEAVVNGRQRNVRQAVFHPHEDVVGRRVVPFLLENPIHLLPLACHPEPRDFIRDVDFGWDFWGFADHCAGKLGAAGLISRTIPIIIP